MVGFQSLDFFQQTAGRKLVAEAELSWDYTGGFAMLLPENQMFRNFDFTANQAEDIRKVEQGK